MRMTALTAFLFTGLLSLLWQTYSDLKKGEVDSRRNWFMYGANLFLVLSMGFNIWLYMGLMIATVLFTSKIKQMFLEGDLEALRWTIPGFFVLNLAYGLVYLASFSLLSVVYVISRRKLKITGNTPAYTIILGAFVITIAFALKF